MYLRPIQAACFVLLAHCTAAHSATYYVNPTSGNDANSGAQFAPYKSLVKANTRAVSGDTVFLVAGQTFQEPLIAKTGITYTSDINNPAVISGRRQVDISGTTWTKVGNVYSTVVPTSITGTVTQVTYGETSNRMLRARTPNIGHGDFGLGLNQFARITQNGNAATLNIANNIVPAGASLEGVKAMIRVRGSDLNEYDVEKWLTTGTSLEVKAVSFTPDWYIAHLYSIDANHGYWLENQLWMLDTGNEWFYDPSTRKLHLWMPNGLTPQGQRIYASVMPNGIVATGVSNVKISNIAVRDTAGDGIYMVDTSNITLNKVSVARSGGRGVSMTGSNSNTIDACTVDSSAKEGIYLGYWSNHSVPTPPKSFAYSTNINITNSTISNSGIGGFAQAAVYLGEGGQFANNVIQNTPYLGVFASLNNVVEKNVVLNSCSLGDDCGGIYVGQPPDDQSKLASASPSTPKTMLKMVNNVKITGNIVDGGTGSGDGVPLGSGTDTRGIYLDDYVNSTNVSGNYVTGFRHAFMLHTAFNNVIVNSLAIGNRSHNMVMQEDAVPTKDGQSTVNGELKGNLVGYNAMVASRNSSSPSLAIPNILHIAEGGSGNTRQFALYDANKYATLNPNASSILAYNYGQDNPVQDMDLATWQGIGNDLNGGILHPYRTDIEIHGYYNSSGLNNKSIACPTTVTANCTKFTNLRTGTAVTFPLSLPPKGSVIVIR